MVDLDSEEVDKIPSIGLPSRLNSAYEEVKGALLPEISIPSGNKLGEQSCSSSESSESSSSEIDLCDALQESQELRQYLRS